MFLFYMVKHLNRFKDCRVYLSITLLRVEARHKPVSRKSMDRYPRRGMVGLFFPK